MECKAVKTRFLFNQRNNIISSLSCHIFPIIKNFIQAEIVAKLAQDRTGFAPLNNLVRVRRHHHVLNLFQSLSDNGFQVKAIGRIFYFLC